MKKSILCSSRSGSLVSSKTLACVLGVALLAGCSAAPSVTSVPNDGGVDSAAKAADRAAAAAKDLLAANSQAQHDARQSADSAAHDAIQRAQGQDANAKEVTVANAGDAKDLAVSNNDKSARQMEAMFSFGGEAVKGALGFLGEDRKATGAKEAAKETANGNVEAAKITSAPQVTKANSEAARAYSEIARNDAAFAVQGYNGLGSEEKIAELQKDFHKLLVVEMLKLGANACLHKGILPGSCTSQIDSLRAPDDIKGEVKNFIMQVREICEKSTDAAACYEGATTEISLASKAAGTTLEALKKPFSGTVGLLNNNNPYSLLSGEISNSDSTSIDQLLNSDAIKKIQLSLAGLPQNKPITGDLFKSNNLTTEMREPTPAKTGLATPASAAPAAAPNSSGAPPAPATTRPSVANSEESVAPSSYVTKPTSNTQPISTSPSLATAPVMPVTSTASSSTPPGITPAIPSSADANSQVEAPDTSHVFLCQGFSQCNYETPLASVYAALKNYAQAVKDGGANSPAATTALGAYTTARSQLTSLTPSDPYVQAKLNASVTAFNQTAQQISKGGADLVLLTQNYQQFYAQNQLVGNIKSTASSLFAKADATLSNTTFGPTQPVAATPPTSVALGASADSNSQLLWDGSGYAPLQSAPADLFGDHT